MAHVHSKATRSYNMSGIKGKDTRPENAVSSFFAFQFSFAYRLFGGFQLSHQLSEIS